MTLLLHYYDPLWHYYDRLPLWHYYDMHTTCVIICIICHNHAIKYFLSRVPHHIEHTLFHVMHYYYTIITFMTHLYILWHANFAKCRQNRRGNQRKMHVGAQTVGVMKAKSPRVCISSLCQLHGLGIHGICDGLLPVPGPDRDSLTNLIDC